MTHHAPAFETVVIFYLGKPKKSIYFSNIHGENLETKAILYTICLYEINISSRKYSDEEKKKLEDFSKAIFKEGEPERTSYDCIEFLHGMIKKFNT